MTQPPRCTSVRTARTYCTTRALARADAHRNAAISVNALLLGHLNAVRGRDGAARAKAALRKAEAAAADAITTGAPLPPSAASPATAAVDKAGGHTAGNSYDTSSVEQYALVRTYRKRAVKVVDAVKKSFQERAMAARMEGKARILHATSEFSEMLAQL